SPCSPSLSPSSCLGEAECSGPLEHQQLDKLLEAETDHSVSVTDGPDSSVTLKERESLFEVPKEKSADDGAIVGATSDDSDIVTLESPPVEDLHVQEETEVETEQDTNNEELNLGSSSSSQYTFTPTETENMLEHLWRIPEHVKELGNRLRKHLSGNLTFPVSSFEPSRDESSSDETSDLASNVARRRRTRKRTMSASETEEKPDEEEPEQQQIQEQHRHRFNTTLNKCILLALVIAFSMGFGHFYGMLLECGTTQIQEQQKLTMKLHEDEINDVRDDLFQCQKEQDAIIDKETPGQLVEEKQGTMLSVTELMDKMTKENQQLRRKHTELQSYRENLAMRLKQTVDEKLSVQFQHQNLAKENQRMKQSLEREEKALSSLQSELRKLREQIRTLEGKRIDAETIINENQKLKDHLEEDKQQMQSFLQQKETLVGEAQMLRRELDKERRTTEALRKELDSLSHLQHEDDDDDTVQPDQEGLQTRLSELEKKLDFEQQRSDLWERLYVEAKEAKEDDPEVESLKTNTRTSKEEFGGKGGKRRQFKENVMNSFKNSFDAVKNSTKEFVRHHKEKIKQAKEAVKENLKKFSDSVKSTFRRFKDSAKNLFSKNKRREESRDARARYRFQQCSNGRSCSADEYKRQATHQGKNSGQYKHNEQFHKNSGKPHKMDPEESPSFAKRTSGFDQFRKHSYHQTPKGCSNVFECAHQESLNLFNKVLDPIKVEEFQDLLHKYLQQEDVNFQHWGELEKFINKFFHNGLFIHDQMLFSDFVNDVEDYLEDIVEYQEGKNDPFDDLDEYIYRHFFGDTYFNQFGPSQLFNTHKYKQSSKNAEGPKHQKHQRKYQQQAYHKERKWNKPRRTNGRHMANVEIELGPMPFDPKY
uniref:Cell cycle progression 1 n=1 Tax=Callorhinchus milii TaxID=7868 RepID=A0A4W3GHJ1_CALMI